MAIPSELATEALKLSAEEREDLVYTLLASFDDEDGCALSPEELAELDVALADADVAGERGEFIRADELLEQMRQIR
jgi:hypothetical protein